MTSDTTSDRTSDDSAVDADVDSGVRGRPRDLERTAAIIDATHAVMHRKGWNELTVGEIAKEAGCGLATIYRRWATKEELVAAAMTARPLPEVAETGDAATDLRALLFAMADEHAEMGESIIGFLAATQSDPLLREAFSTSVIAVARERIGGLLRAVLGDDSAHVELLIDSIAGSLVVRAGIFGNFTTPQEWADEVMALIESLRS